METQVLITPITIYSKGDESVGIFSASWTITDDVYVENDDIEKFREELKIAWEFIADDAQIIFATDKNQFNECIGEPSIEESVSPKSDVSQQRKLLVKFANYCNSFNIENNNIYEEDVDDFLNQ